MCTPDSVMRAPFVWSRVREAQGLLPCGSGLPCGAAPLARHPLCPVLLGIKSHGRSQRGHFLAYGTEMSFIFPNKLLSLRPHAGLHLARVLEGGWQVWQAQAVGCGVHGVWMAAATLGSSSSHLALALSEGCETVSGTLMRGCGNFQVPQVSGSSGQRSKVTCLAPALSNLYSCPGWSQPPPLITFCCFRFIQFK